VRAWRLSRVGILERSCLRGRVITRLARTREVGASGLVGQPSSWWPGATTTRPQARPGEGRDEVGRWMASIDVERSQMPHLRLYSL
jgi:hypothetical protein